MQKWLASVFILVLSLAAIAHAQRGRGGGPPPPPRPVAGHGVEVPGWWARLDDVKEPTTGLKFAPMNGGLHATTGPNMIFWDPQQVASGAYTVKATFTVTKQPSHEVSYGLFIGGTDLETDKQKYSYFLIRENGQFLIKKRAGSSTSNVAGDWAPNPAVMAISGGTQKNELLVQVSKERVSFMANGKEVASHPATTIDTSGVVGLRIGHGMDIQIDGFAVEAQK